MTTLAHPYYRLLLLAVPPGSGKTPLLKELCCRQGIPYLNVNLALSQRLLDLAAKERPLRARYLLAGHGDLVKVLPNAQVTEAACAIAGQFPVVRAEIGATTMRLRDILLGKLELALGELGIAYTFPPMDAAPNSKDFWWQ